MRISDKTYKILKYIAMYAMPALATLILTLGYIWSLPYTEPIAATVTALDVFLSALLGLSSKEFYNTHAIVDINKPEIDTETSQNAAGDKLTVETEKTAENGTQSATGA